MPGWNCFGRLFLAYKSVTNLWWCFACNIAWIHLLLTGSSVEFSFFFPYKIMLTEDRNHFTSSGPIEMTFSCETVLAGASSTVFQQKWCKWASLCLSWLRGSCLLPDGSCVSHRAFIMLGRQTAEYLLLKVAFPASRCHLRFNQAMSGSPINSQ